MKKLLSERVYYRTPFPNVSIIVDLNGDIECNRFVWAIKETVNRFDLIKSSIVMEPDGECFYRLQKEANVKIEYNTNENEVMSRCEFIDQQRKYCYHLDKGQTLHFFIQRYTKGLQIALSAHHIIADGLSLIYLLKEIVNTYSCDTERKENLPINLLTCNEKHTSELGRKRMIAFKKSIEKRWLSQKKVFDECEYNSMFERVTKLNLKIREVIVEGDELENLIDQCKQNQISITSALITMIFYKMKDIQKVEIPMSIRTDKQHFGNYVTMLSVSYKDLHGEDFWEKAKCLHNKIKQKIEYEKKSKDQLVFITEINSNLYDSLFFAKYGHYENRMTNETIALLDMKRETRQVMLSNLGQVHFDANKQIAVDNLYFYPPATEFRTSTIGIVTNKDKMTITVQSLESDNECLY